MTHAAQLLDSGNKMCEPEMEVQQVSLDFTDRGLTPLPEVGPEKGKAVCSGEKPGLCTSELQSVQENEMWVFSFYNGICIYVFACTARHVWLYSVFEIWFIISSVCYENCFEIWFIVCNVSYIRLYCVVWLFLYQPLRRQYVLWLRNVTT